MVEEQAQEKDNFWLYVGGLAVVLIGIVFTVKSSESEKYAQVRGYEDEEKNLMNIRVIKPDYELPK